MNYIQSLHYHDRAGKFLIDGVKYQFRPLSLHLYDNKSNQRYIAVLIVTNSAFEPFVLILISLNLIISCVFQFWSVEEWAKFLKGWQIGFLSFLITEFILKVVAMGFLFENGYLESHWNKLDMLVLASNYLGPEGNIIRSFRLLKWLHCIPSIKKTSQIVCESISNISYILYASLASSLVFLIAELMMEDGEVSDQNGLLKMIRNSLFFLITSIFGNWTYSFDQKISIKYFGFVIGACVVIFAFILLKALIASILIQT